MGETRACCQCYQLLFPMDSTICTSQPLHSCHQGPNLHKSPVFRAHTSVRPRGASMQPDSDNARQQCDGKLHS
ncbi:hypothetical protein E2C01_024658 [Portunus trituberculatus]|uniref:Uncharacterized protein n=1 Tax=Portunus trituberculatus TaxID=210409 RepID=A0A5B7EB69_PORTR|nr:hypothetical protein [Portunus trituberculatus]